MDNKRSNKNVNKKIKKYLIKKKHISIFVDCLLMIALFLINILTKLKITCSVKLIKQIIIK